MPRVVTLRSPIAGLERPRSHGPGSNDETKIDSEYSSRVRTSASSVAVPITHACAAVGRIINLSSSVVGLCQPEEIASAVAFLAGPDGAWINGQVLRANDSII